MNVSWLGYRSIRLETKEGSILIDPHTKEVGIRAPRLRDDLILSSWGSLDSEPEGDSFVISGPGEYERRGISVRGILSYRDKDGGKEEGLNTAYVIRADDMTVCHLGGIGQQQLTPEQLEAIGDIDILFLPVGGNGVMDAKAASHVVAQIEPKIVIPLQYKMSDSPYKADDVSVFIKEIGLEVEKVEKLKLSKKELPVEEVQLFVLGN